LFRDGLYIQIIQGVSSTRLTVHEVTTININTIIQYQLTNHTRYMRDFRLLQRSSRELRSSESLRSEWW